MAWYRTGTISLSNGSTAVTGVGTAWIANAAVGEALYAPDGRLYEIVAIVSDTVLTLGSNYLGTNTSGQSYVIVPSQSYIRDLAAQAAALVNNYSTIYNTVGQGKFQDGTLAAPGVTFNQDQDTGFYRSAANEVTFVANGVAQFKYGTGGVTFLNGINATSLTLSGNTTIGDASGDTLTVNAGITTFAQGTANQVQYLNGSKVLTGSSNLTFNGTTLTAAGFSGPLNGNVTGDVSGNAGTVTNGVYTTGDQTIGGTKTFSINPVYSGGTANGVAYLNGSKVLTTGSALTFDGTTLTTAATANGANVEVLKASNVGSGNNTQASIGFYAAGTKYAEIIGGYSGAPSLKYNATTTIGYHQWQINSAEQMRLTSTGLGIGTSSPVSKLHVNSGSAVATYATIGNLNNGVQIGVTSAGFPTIGRYASFGISFGGNSGSTYVEQMLLDSSGNLGLGVTPTTGGYGTIFDFGTFGGSLVSQPIDTDYYPVNLTANANSFGAYSWKYRVSASATRYEQVSGKHQWYTAPSGTAGSAISFTQAMTLDANGNLGIGITSVGAKLDIASTSTSQTIFRALNNGTNWAQIACGFNGTSVNYYDAGTQIFRDASQTERMRIDYAGNVGIGTSSPSSKLHVSGGDIQISAGNALKYSSTAYITPENNVSGAEISTTGIITFKAGSGPTERMRIDSSGNVGIGTSSPSQRLHVYKSSYPILYIADSSYSSDLGIDSGSGNFVLGNNSAAATIIKTGGTERMRIDSSGNLLVGTTSIPSSSVNGFSVTNSGNTIQIASATQTLSTWQHNNYTSGSRYSSAFYVGASLVGYISHTSTTTTYSTSSDYRLKENIQPMQNALDVVAQLNPVTYTWKADGSDGQGFIAHELQAVVPDCVTGEKDAVRIVDVLDDEGRKIGTKEEPVYQGIDTSFLVATLTKAIQEQQEQINQLKAEVASLKGV